MFEHEDLLSLCKYSFARRMMVQVIKCKYIGILILRLITSARFQLPYCFERKGEKGEGWEVGGYGTEETVRDVAKMEMKE